VIIAGGSYLESCKYPRWERLFGSGIRASLALQRLSPSSSLLTYAPALYRADVEATLKSAGLDVQATESPNSCAFRWLHPFELLSWPKKDRLPPLIADAEAVLRFGMMEGSAVVSAKRAVYDPQNEGDGFFANGSEASELVMILSESELLRQPGTVIDHAMKREAMVSQAVDNLIFQYRGRFEFFAVLLKDKVGGVNVYIGDEPKPVPTYAAESFFKIGAGDVFAAAFAHAWMERGLDIFAAADHAARSLAWFVEGARLPLPREVDLPIRACLPPPERVRIVGAHNLEMGQLIVRTEDLLVEHSIGVVFDLIDRVSDQADTSLPTLILLREDSNIAEIQESAVSSLAAQRTVVYSPGTTIKLTPRYFPSARITDDYASALFHLLREPLP
jgi:hypothetical protein